MTLLTIVQNATDEMGNISRPSSVIGSTNTQVRQLLRFANKEGVELMRAINWQELTTEHTFTTVAADVQTSSIPADFDRFCQDSIFDRTLSRKIWGPITESDWQKRKAYTTASTIEYWFRVKNGSIMMTPQPSAGDTVAYEYISNKFCQDSSATAQAAWAADDDTARISEELITLGIIWRFLKANGLEWQTPFQEYTDQVSKIGSRQKGAPTLQAAGPNYYREWPNIPEGNWA